MPRALPTSLDHLLNHTVLGNRMVYLRFIFISYKNMTLSNRKTGIVYTADKGTQLPWLTINKY